MLGEIKEGVIDKIIQGELTELRIKWWVNISVVAAQRRMKNKKNHSLPISEAKSVHELFQNP